MVDLGIGWRIILKCRLWKWVWTGLKWIKAGDILTGWVSISVWRKPCSKKLINFSILM
jgi:hypothetical protein